MEFCKFGSADRFHFKNIAEEQGFLHIIFGQIRQLVTLKDAIQLENTRWLHNFLVVFNDCNILYNSFIGFDPMSSNWYIYAIHALHQGLDQ